MPLGRGLASLTGGGVIGFGKHSSPRFCGGGLLFFRVSGGVGEVGKKIASINLHLINLIIKFILVLNSLIIKCCLTLLFTYFILCCMGFWGFGESCLIIYEE